MKLIKSIVRPDKVDAVKDALGKINISGMTVTEVRGHGKQKGHTAIYRGKEYNVSLLPKMEIEMVVADDVVEDVVKSIITAARTGEIGDPAGGNRNPSRRADGIPPAGGRASAQARRRDRPHGPRRQRRDVELEHDPEKWVPVFGKDHAQTKS